MTRLHKRVDPTRHMYRRFTCLCLIFVLSLGSHTVSWALDLNRDVLKKGMPLNEVLQAWGQPLSMEWVTVKGDPILFMFYATNGRDLLKKENGEAVLPLGFKMDRLEGWGRSFYKRLRSSK